MASTGAARFTAHFTDAQKEAIMRAVLVEGMTVADAMRGAAAGTLGVPAFTIGRYAYDLVKDGRERYEANNDSALHHSIDVEMKALEIAALKHARATRARLKGDGSDSPDAIAKAAKALSDTRRARRDTQGAKTKPAPVQTAGENHAAKPKSDDALSNLLGLAGKATKPSQEPNAAA
jgi:hypothetical protein